MGRIKSLAVKRTTRKLLKEHPDLFSTSYEKNKEVLSRIIDADKKARNCVAGYITKTLKGKSNAKQIA